MKHFNYYKPKPLIITILGFFTLIVCFKDWYVNKTFDSKLAKELVVNIASAAGLILVFFKMYNKYLWNKPILEKLIDFPNLKGGWYGTMISSYKDENDKFIEKDCLMEIHQQGTDIFIVCYYADKNENIPSSKSESWSFSLNQKDELTTQIVYTYLNTPLVARDNNSDLNKHTGTSELLWNKETPLEIYVEYYNKDRNSKGRMKLLKYTDKIENAFYRPN
ncbi:MAG: hypothetical protein QM541_04760 [Flavobacterium sp.]|nr:hypothetical protein [Flavobacterium sp.]